MTVLVACGAGTGAVQENNSNKRKQKVEGECMEYKRLIKAMLTEISDEDVRFLRRLYTLVKIHIEKQEQRIQFRDSEK